MKKNQIIIIQSVRNITCCNPVKKEMIIGRKVLYSPILIFIFLPILFFSCSNKYDGLDTNEKHTIAIKLINSENEFSSDDFSELKNIYKSILKKNPKDALALNNLAYGYCKLYYFNSNKNNFNQAIKLLEQAHEYADNQYADGTVFRFACEGYIINGSNFPQNEKTIIPIIWIIDNNLFKLYKIQDTPESKQLRELEWSHLER